MSRAFGRCSNSRRNYRETRGNVSTKVLASKIQINGVCDSADVKTRFRLTLAAVLFVRLATASAFAQGLFSITNVKFGSFVDPESFEVRDEAKDEISRMALNKGALWLGLTIVGDENTMRYIDDENSLWLQADLWINGQKRDFAEIGMDYGEWERDHKRLKDELNERGTFTWRTRMRTKQISPAVVEIKFFDKHGNSIGPINYQGTYVARIRIK